MIPPPLYLPESPEFWQAMGEWVERVLVREIARRVHEATVIADRIPRLGKTGSGRE